MIALSPVTAEDVPEVVRLVADVLAEFGLTFGAGSRTDAGLLELPTSYTAHGGAFWVARRGDEVLGTCGVFPVDSTIYELRKMYLRPASRGLGIGKQLLDVAIAWARERGAAHMVLDTIHEMSRAIAFYEAHGFVRDDSQIRGARCSRGYVRAL